MEEEKTKQKRARDWCAKEYAKRAKDDARHPSFLASELLEQAEAKFGLASFGVEGWSTGYGSGGVSYLNYGDPYDATIVARTTMAHARFYHAKGGWAAYSG